MPIAHAVRGITALPAATQTPLQIWGSNLIGWYEADTGTFTTSGGGTPSTNGTNVGRWEDQSGSANHLNVQDASLPTLTTSFATSKTAVSFAAASSQGLRTAIDTVAIGTGTHGSMFALVQLDASGADSRIGSYHGNAATHDDNNDGSAAFLNANAPGPTIYSYRNGDFSDKAVSTGTPAIVGAVYDGTNLKAYVNNVAGTADPCALAWTSPGTLSVGYHHAVGVGDNKFFTGQIAALVFIKEEALAGEMTSLKSYWNSKYGLSL